ncbi:hypothetical protein ACHWQZ_G009792 [Mnemiopsis leidyi]
MRYGRLRDMSMKTLETLTFDNAALRDLPVDTSSQNVPRQVKNACFSRVDPTPLSSPKTVVYSSSAMRLLNLPQSELDRKEFPSYLCGSKLIPGAEYAAHCYCGHQFGYFSGQLGDGATMYVGEVVNNELERWEIQFKGAGKTPFSRTADGRKVLRSSLREFLCSEAMFHLGVPTTRAVSCVVSTDTVVRDVLYDGHPINEKCTVILRIAPTFIRFGSFEIFKSIDRLTGRHGPSVGKTDILKQLLRYTKTRFYPDVAGDVEEEDTVVAMYREIMERTARLAAHWQTVGFCHGVLNTDNMSILGLTIDYGPYGFMETFDPGFICNGSDKGGRYSYEAQPAICKWNVKKLGEMFALEVSQEKLDQVLQSWEQVFEIEYNKLMRRKLGLLTEGSDDAELISKLFATMRETHSDFTTTFLLLQSFDLLDFKSDEAVNQMLTNCLSIEEVTKTLKPTYSKADCAALLQIINQFSLASGNEAGFNPLARYGIEVDSVLRDHQIHQDLESFGKMTADDRDKQCREKWRDWLQLYKDRVQVECDKTNDPNYRQTRIDLQRKSNPVVVPRNHILQRAIDRAELGDYSLARRLLEVFEQPFEKPAEQWLAERDVGDKGACTVT